MSSIEHYRNAYVAASAKAGDIGRQFNFAGIALIWIFKSASISGVPPGYSVPLGLYWPTQLIVLSLILDLLQYMYKSGFLGIYAWRLERAEKKRVAKPAEGKKIEVDDWLNVPTLIFFWGKLITTSVGFMLLLSFVSKAVVFKG